MKKALLFFFIAQLLFSCKKEEIVVIKKINFNPNITYGTIKDIDNNLYKTVVIGSQTWMAENLRTTKYNDGIDIPYISNDNEWGNIENGAFCTYYNTDNKDTIEIYGRLYNWHAVKTNKLCPIGWHVPNENDWQELANYLGDELTCGGKLKERNTDHWIYPNISATNESGFTALPAGERSVLINRETNEKQIFYYFAGEHGSFWSSSPIDYEEPFGPVTDTLFAHSSTLLSDTIEEWDKYLLLTYSSLNTGLSIRCLKD